MVRKLYKEGVPNVEVEVKGMKLVVPPEMAERKDRYKIGDNVKVLKKSYSSTKSHPGVIVGFDNFMALPTIVVAYLDESYSGASIEFLYLNEQTKDDEICRMGEGEMLVDKKRVVDMLDRLITAKDAELDELKRKKTYFLRNFAEYFTPEGS